MSEFRQGSLHLIRERSASPTVLHVRKSGREQKRNTKRPIQKDSADLDLRIDAMPPQVVTKSSAAKRLPPLALNRNDIDKKTGKNSWATTDHFGVTRASLSGGL